MGNEISHLEKEIKLEPFGTKMYWKLRCNYLEKAHDKTYTTQERANCHLLYLKLVFKEPTT